MYHVTQRLYLTDDGRVVFHGDPDAHSLLYPAGAMVPDSHARRYGLTGDEEPIVASPAGPSATRAHAAPPAARVIRATRRKEQ